MCCGGCVPQGWKNVHPVHLAGEPPMRSTDELVYVFIADFLF
jgi:hypothetical protein